MLSHEKMSRRKMLKMSVIGVAGAMLGCMGKDDVCAASNDTSTTTKPYNLLFINADQLRFDALSCAGNDLISTPNIDRLARQGVRFEMAVTPQPMCVGARASFATGIARFSAIPFWQDDWKDRPVANFDCGSFDQHLTRAGYHAEYHGTADYPTPLVDCYRNGNPSAEWLVKYNRYLEETLGKPPKPDTGEFASGLSGWPYVPDPVDYQLRASKGNIPGHNCPGVDYGVYRLSAEHTYSAFVADETINALKQLKDKPFALTTAFLAPHPPSYVAKPYAGSVNPDRMRHPLTMNDRRINTPYEQNPWQVDGTEKRYMNIIHARYYELVLEIDYQVGRILDALKELGLADRTLVIFAADHGEMLGDHGCMQKFMPYQEAVRVPLVMRMPGKIPAERVVTNPVSTLDLFATIFDYLGLKCPKQDGKSLRPLVNRKRSGHPDFAVSQLPGYVAYVSRDWKYVWYDSSESRLLYDLRRDPLETTNLLGSNPDKAKYIGEAERIHKEMLPWMEKVSHPYLPQFTKSGAG